MSEKPRPRSPKTTRKPVKAGVTRSKAVKGSAVAPTDPHKRRGQWHASGAIVRNRLLEALDTDPRARLIVVQAPAGYGKSSLLRQHCNRCAEAGEKVAWVRMDSQSSGHTAAQAWQQITTKGRHIAGPAAQPFGHFGSGGTGRGQL